MGNHRIYGENIQIKPENTRDFYNQRAKNINQMQCPYTTVLLNDEEPEHARQWNEFEKQYIQPELKIDNKSNVLDIGCGMGRWAETIIPVASYYLGVDYSEEMIKTAAERNQYADKNYEFMNLSFQETVEKGQDFFKTKFNRLIIGGVCMYINDSELERSFKKLENLLADSCIIYFTETVALEKRLTLDEFYSEALKTNYDVIYRTPTQYQEYYKMLLEKGFTVLKQGYLPKLNGEDKYRETDRYYTILSR
ncbi:MAG TPA: methyltransferase domain-containing protein [Mobilitalea sp.]|nr:methyltransferase domain-containing protein [Mobilitalea sp.]